MGLRLTWPAFPWALQTQCTATGRKHPWAILAWVGSSLCFGGVAPFSSEAVLSWKGSDAPDCNFLTEWGQVLGVTVHQPGLTVGESTLVQESLSRHAE